MKKIIFSLLVSTVLLTGCDSYSNYSKNTHSQIDKAEQAKQQIQESTKNVLKTVEQNRAL